MPDQRPRTRFIFITGGVVSSLGKGIAAASIGRLLVSRGLKVAIQKFDPYINVDPGTMSPFQHGEVFVTEDGADDSAAPSPRITLGQASRLGAKDKSSRAGSIPATRETSVKIEDGVESVASMDSAPSFSKGESLPRDGARSTNRVTFKAGETVFYRHKDKLLEGEGILCRVTAVIGEGKQRRYEIQDVDTDITANATGASSGGKAPAVANPSGNSSSSFRASISSLMQIPESNERLPDLPKGKQVFALYPETTTFYRGEVSVSWRAKSDPGGHVRVRFEGEMENIESQVVERRYVLLDR